MNAIKDSVEIPRKFRLYKHTQTTLRYVYYILEECLNGFWLGILSRDSIHRLDELYYQDENLYVSDAYNKSGLFQWEEDVIDRFYFDRKSILLLSSGGGREIYGLRKRPFNITAYECSPKFVSYANSFLSRHLVEASVEIIGRNEIADTGILYDGAIVGWGGYMLIQGRARRISFLRKLRGQLEPGSPVLLSFFANTFNKKRFILTSKIANVLRWFRNREMTDVGDFFAPNFVHFFTRDEIANEMSAAGFKLEHYSAEPYGHAVGTANGTYPSNE